MTPKERREYDAHMDTIMVQNDVLATARDEGLAEGLEKGLEKGRAEGLASVAGNLMASGMDDAMICKVTGLSEQKVDAIRNSL